MRYWLHRISYHAEVSYPFVIKAVASGVIHKADAGAVRVVADEEEVGSAYPSVLGQVATRMPWLTLLGVIVQEMVKGDKRLEVYLERLKRDVFPFRYITRLFKEGAGELAVEEIEVRDYEQIDSLDSLEECAKVYRGMWALWLQYPQVKRMEMDVLCHPSPPKVIDAKLFFFEL